MNDCSLIPGLTDTCPTDSHELVAIVSSIPMIWDKKGGKNKAKKGGKRQNKK